MNKIESKLQALFLVPLLRMHRGPLRPKIDLTELAENGRIGSQRHGKWQNHIDFERKKVKKILHPTKVTNPHFFFLGLFSNLVLKVEAYYSFLMRTHGLESLLKWSSHVRLSKFINCSWGPQGAHRKKWG